MRRCFLHCFSGYHFIRKWIQRATVGVLKYTTIFCYAFLIILFSAAVVNTKGNIRIVLQDHSQAFHLIVRQCIHWIDQNCPDTTGERSGLFFPKQIIYDGQNKTLCLARTGTRCHNQIMLLVDLSDGFLLMQIQLSLQLDLLVVFLHIFFEISEQRRKFSLFNQAFYVLSYFKGIANIKIGPLRHRILLIQFHSKLVGIVSVCNMKTGQYIADEFSLYAFRRFHRIKHLFHPRLSVCI